MLSRSQKSEARANDSGKSIRNLSSHRKSGAEVRYHTPRDAIRHRALRLAWPCGGAAPRTRSRTRTRHSRPTRHSSQHTHPITQCTRHTYHHPGPSTKTHALTAPPPPPSGEASWLSHAHTSDHPRDSSRVRFVKWTQLGGRRSARGGWPARVPSSHAGTHIISRGAPSPPRAYAPVMHLSPAPPSPTAAKPAPIRVRLPEQRGRAGLQQSASCSVCTYTYHISHTPRWPPDHWSSPWPPPPPATVDAGPPDRFEFRLAAITPSPGAAPAQPQHHLR